MRFLFITLALLISFASSGNTIGENTRYKWDGWPHIPKPLDRTGALKHPSGERCTASYLGTNLLLTAAHCVMKENKNQLQKGDYLFEHIRLPNGGYWDSRKITRFHFVELKQLTTQQSAKDHWVILEMDRPLTDAGRYFGYSYPGDEIYDEYHDSNFDLSIAGFSADFNDGTYELTFSDSNCDIKEHLFDGMVAYHDCDSGPRDSGSPLYSCKQNEYGNWKKCYISAIHIAGLSPVEDGNKTRYPRYERTNANLAVTMKSFKNVWYYLVLGGARPTNLISVNNN